MSSLPNKFTAQNIESGVLVLLEKQSDGMYKAEWEAEHNGKKHVQFYEESTIKTWLNTYLKIVKEEVNTMSLPSKFEFVVGAIRTVYTAEVIGERVLVTWEVDSEQFDTEYEVATVKAWVQDGWWLITKTLGVPITDSAEEGILEKIILDKITTFAKETCADVIIDNKGFTIQYRDFDFVRVDSLEKLLELMGTISAFHKVMHGKQTG